MGWLEKNYDSRAEEEFGLSLETDSQPMASYKQQHGPVFLCRFISLNTGTAGALCEVNNLKKATR